ncbi:MAG: LysM peptidoglycan-binding domain-containing protein [Chthoniobacterales bacterium]|nr:LysM peptidoglycan-binding domain-containing protein [Chthoniobacterales bacterium]
MVKTLHARAAATEKDFEDYDGEAEPNMKFSHALLVVLVLHVLAVGGVFAFNSLKSQRAAKGSAKEVATQSAASAAAEVETKAQSSPAASKTVPERPAAPTTAAKLPVSTQADTGGPAYTVLAGDTLTRIAAAQKTTVEALEQANGITANSAIRVGQILKIPARTSAAKPDALAGKTVESKATPPKKSPEVVPTSEKKTTALKPVPAGKASEGKTASAAEGVEPQAVTKTVPAPVAKSEEPPASADKTYTVAKGDNPYSIAKKLKVKYNDLIKANNIQDPTKLQIGQKLIVP